MATPPTYVGEYETVWNNNTTPKTVSITTAVGDILVVCGEIVDFSTDTLSTPTNTGTAETFTLQQTISVNLYSQVFAWTCVATAAQTTTVSVARTNTSTRNLDFGYNVIHWRGSAGVGASNKANGATPGATVPSVAVTCAANSAAVVINIDWNTVDGTTRTPLSVNSSTGSENTYFLDAGNTTNYVQRYADTGTAGSNTFGWSAPSGQEWAIIAVEILGTAGAAYPFGITTPTPRYRS